MKKIRVLIVDDSTVIRRLLTDSLATDPAIEIAGTAANGKIALAKMSQVNPDIVTLDMEMPEMDGLTTLGELRKLYPKLPIIMFSTLTQRGAEATLEALARGASDYVTKPANVGSVTAAIQNVQNELIPKIKMFCGHKPVTAPVLRLSTPVRPGVAGGASLLTPAGGVAKARTRPVDIAVIGCSTGGPNALAAVLPKIPADFPVPIMVVQHMPPIFTTHLAARLNDLCPLRVVEAAEGDELRPGGVWIAPGNYHMTLRRAGTQMRVSLNQNMPENSCRPAVDVLFRSAAQTYGAGVMAIVMTGMGQDGQRGAEVIRQAGGSVIAQDEHTSVVWGMPGSVVQAGLANTVLPLHRLADEIIHQAQLARPSRVPTRLGAFA